MGKAPGPLVAEPASACGLPFREACHRLVRLIGPGRVLPLVLGEVLENKSVPTLLTLSLSS